MLINLKNVQKTYNTKTGVTFRAISNVSLSFDDRGMVFLLGKSGSGKTTLLNLIGGLDSIDSGAIYVGGKNLARVSGGEIDNYRNTMVGFVFQEFNLIDYMSVYDNVRLALDMQSDKDSKKIEAALEKVDLLDKKTEKVKNLSGGQRQRVGIARAIVKNPSIILADEPTGALDSATGEEVMKIFRQLSKDKLVIIVSHDMEKALDYADRIVEMKDGTIYRDVRRKKDGEKIDYSHIHITSNTLIRLEKGISLKETDAQQINEILNQKGKKAYINVDTNPKKIKALFPNLREAVESDQTIKAEKTVKADETEKTDVNDSQSTVEPSKDSFIPYKSFDSEIKKVNFKKSKLSTASALKMGAKNLNLKKGRMIFTIIIAVIAFVLFGTSVSFAGYDVNQAYINTIKKENYHSIIVKSGGDTNYSIKENEIEKLKKQNPSIGVFNQYRLELFTSLRLGLGNIGYFNSILETDDVSLLKMEMLAGSSALSDFNNVVMSQAAAREYLKSEIIPSAKTYDDLIGKKITLLVQYTPEKEYTISGIFKTDLDKYKSDRDDMRLRTDFQNYIEGVLIVKTGFREHFISHNGLSGDHTLQINYSGHSNGYQPYCSLIPNNTELCRSYGIGVDYVLEDSDGELNYDMFTLQENEIIISSSLLGNLNLKDPLRERLPEYPEDTEEYTEDDKETEDKAAPFWWDPSTNVGTIPITDFNNDQNKSITIYYGYTSTSFFSTDIKIKGIIRDSNQEFYSDGIIILNSKTAEKIGFSEMNTSKLMLTLSGSNKANANLIKYLSANGFSVESEFAASYESLLGVVSVLYKVIIGFSLVLCLLVVVMLFTFISSSIKSTKKQIGILRALGARKLDTFKIYALEGAVIGVISFAVASAVLLIFAPIINLVFSASAGFYFSVLNIGFKDIFALFLLMAAVTFISVLIPLRKFNKITPIKAIVEKE